MTTVSTPPPSVTLLTTHASVWWTLTARMERSVLMASVWWMSVMRHQTAMGMTRSAMLLMTTASTAAETTVTPMMAAAQVRYCQAQAQVRLNDRGRLDKVRKVRVGLS